MHILFWIVVGIIAGALAKVVVPGQGPGGVIGDLIIGVVGAVLGGFIFREVVGHSMYGWVGSTLVAFIGAVVLLLILRALSTRRVV
jgi:uncharacterized membrane protein YeaQ/YmgE (transglycosylase-associated protein family)